MITFSVKLGFAADVSTEPQSNRVLALNVAGATTYIVDFGDWLAHSLAVAVACQCHFVRNFVRPLTEGVAMTGHA